MNLFKSTGTFLYTPEPNNLRVLIDPDISRYYRAMIPKWIRSCPQMFAPHISVVRKEPVIPNLAVWGRHQGKEIEFHYEPTIYEDSKYFWLNVFCVGLEDIRVELGLPVSSPYTLPPSGFKKCFHTTIGNKKFLT